MKVLRFFSSIIYLGCLILPFSLYSATESKSDKKTKYPVLYNPGIKVDGNAQDWPSRYLYCNFDAKVFYATANDTSDLCLCIKVLDPTEHMSLIKNGLTIFLDPLGKKKKDYALNIKFTMERHREKPPDRFEDNNLNRFPHDSLPRKSIQRGFQGGLPGQNVPKIQQGMNNSHMVSTIFTINGFHLRADSAGSHGFEDNEIQIAASIDTLNDLVIEARVPLSAFRINPWVSGNMSMGFEITSEKQMPHPPGTPNQPRRMGQMPGSDNGPSFSAGGMPGGQHQGGGAPGGDLGMGAHGGPPVGMDNENQSKTYYIWHKFSLAHQK
jgi:hypothetical protein